MNNYPDINASEYNSSKTTREVAHEMWDIVDQAVPTSKFLDACDEDRKFLASCSGRLENVVRPRLIK
ncbi:hypothetical protein J4466_00265 [Candidatus Pacearchaeota archaeon]|nr:hypothetical protein [Candidatus Pacearchaeota archaeon]